MGRSPHNAVLLQGSIYVGSGYEGPSDKKRKDCYRLDIYNLSANQWNSISTPCCWFAMTVTLKTIFVLDTGQWKQYSEMLWTARLSPTAVGYQSKLILVGGAIIVQKKWIKLSY